MGGSLGRPLTAEEIQRVLERASCETVTPEQIAADAEFLDDTQPIGRQRWAEYNRKFNALLKGEAG